MQRMATDDGAEGLGHARKTNNPRRREKTEDDCAQRCTVLRFIRQNSELISGTRFHGAARPTS